MEMQFRELNWTELVGRWHILCTLCWEMWGRLWSVSRVGCRGLKPYLCQFFLHEGTINPKGRDDWANRNNSYSSSRAVVRSTSASTLKIIDYYKLGRRTTYPDVFKQSFAISADRANEKPEIVDDPVVSLFSLPGISSSVHTVALYIWCNRYTNIRNIRNMTAWTKLRNHDRTSEQVEFGSCKKKRLDLRLFAVIRTASVPPQCAA